MFPAKFYHWFNISLVLLLFKVVPLLHLHFYSVESLLLHCCFSVDAELFQHCFSIVSVICQHCLNVVQRCFNVFAATFQRYISVVQNSFKRVSLHDINYTKSHVFILSMAGSAQQDHTFALTGDGGSGFRGADRAGAVHLALGPL